MPELGHITKQHASYTYCLEVGPMLDRSDQTLSTSPFLHPQFDSSGTTFEKHSDPGCY